MSDYTPDKDAPVEAFEDSKKATSKVGGFAVSVIAFLFFRFVINPLVCNTEQQADNYENVLAKLNTDFKNETRVHATFGNNVGMSVVLPLPFKDILTDTSVHFGKYHFDLRYSPVLEVGECVFALCKPASLRSNVKDLLDDMTKDMLEDRDKHLEESYDSTFNLHPCKVIYFYKVNKTLGTKRYYKYIFVADGEYVYNGETVYLIGAISSQSRQLEKEPFESFMGSIEFDKFERNHSYELRDYQGLFAVAFPKGCADIEYEKSLASNKSNDTVHIYSTSADSVVYTLAYYDYSGQISSYSDEKLLDAEMVSLPFKSNPIQKSDRTEDGITTRTFSTKSTQDNKEISINGKLILVRPRLYFLMTADANPNEGGMAQSTEFLESFGFLKE